MDIVERLRACHGVQAGDPECCCAEAAAEIERLRAALQRLVTDYEDVPDPTDADGQAVFEDARRALEPKHKKSPGRGLVDEPPGPSLVVVEGMMKHNVSAVFHDEADGTTYLVCMPDGPSRFADNLKGVCCDCGVHVIYRWYAPEDAVRICVDCFSRYGRATPSRR